MFEVFMQACTVYVLMEHTPLGKAVDMGAEAMSKVLLKSQLIVGNQIRKITKK